jgi:hypothetical protein
MHGGIHRVPGTGQGTTESALIFDSYDRNFEWCDYWLEGIARDRMLDGYPPEISQRNPNEGRRAGTLQLMKPDFALDDVCDERGTASISATWDYAADKARNTTSGSSAMTFSSTFAAPLGAY